MRTVIALLLASAAVAAQTEKVEVDPIECWWRTSATGVRIGETFTVILTCSVLESDAARVVPDESRLDPGVVQLPPFEVVGGTRAKDVTTAGRRFFQYSYQLRVIAENVFATTVSLPALEITYKIESRADMGDSVAGRDQSYALPSLAIRVLSIVPDTALDIREAPVATFGEIEDVAFRGTAMRVGGWILLALGGLMLVLALLRLLRRRSVDTPKSRQLSDAVILRGVRQELTSVQDQSRSGWTSDLAGRALSALRVVAAYAGGRHVSQRVTNVTSAGSSIVQSDGQVAVSGRLGTSALVSAAMTAQHADDELREALSAFAAARYGRDETFDSKLDDGLEKGIRVTDRLLAQRPALERLWKR
jgi:hypothetical protein